MEVATRFDIIWCFPVELFLDIFDCFFEPEVVQFRGVSQTWKAMIDSLNWRERARRSGWFPHQDWPDELPLQLHCTQLGENLRHLQISAIRLSSAWDEKLVETCPELRTLIIENMYSASLGGGTILAGSRVEVLKLHHITPECCTSWFRSLHNCRFLRDLHISILTNAARIIPVSQSAQTLPSELVETIPSLHILTVGILPFHVQLPGAPRLQMIERLQWMEDDWEDEPDQGNINMVLRAALLDLQKRAPELHTFEVIETNGGGILHPLQSFLHGFFIDMVSKAALRNLRFNNMVFLVSWVDMCRSLRLYDIKAADERLHAIPSNRNPFWKSKLEKLEISFSLRCPYQFHKVIPLAQNLVHLKLKDPQGMLANGLFYTILQGAITSPLLSLRFLSLSRLPTAEVGWKDPFDGSWTPSEPRLPVGFDAIGKGDIIRLAAAFPNLVVVELIKVTDIDVDTVRTILESMLDDLKRLTIVDKDRSKSTGYLGSTNKA